MKTNDILLLVVVGVALIAGTATSTTASDALPSNIAATIAQNQLNIMGYSWMMRTTVSHEGEVRLVKLEKVRFDRSGRLQKTLVGKDLKEKKVIGPIRKKRERDKLSDAIKWSQEMGTVALHYLFPDPEKLNIFVDRAQIWKGQKDSGDITKIFGQDFLQYTDSIELLVNHSTSSLSQMTVETRCHGIPMNISARYRSIINQGPTIIDHAEVVSPSKKISLIVETFDYVRQQ